MCCVVVISKKKIVSEPNTGKACATVKLEGGNQGIRWKSKQCDHTKFYVCQYTDECPVGYTGDPCVRCQVGTYKPTTGSASCTSCGARKTTTGTGSDNVDDCGKKHCRIFRFHKKYLRCRNLFIPHQKTGAE